MHNKIFERQGQIGLDDIKQYASDLGLDKAAFVRCLDSGRKTADVKGDVEVAESVGITGTPAFLINGRLLTGAQPFENFAAIIDDELARARRTSTPHPATPGGAK
jgi:predicted DsbA family dithiol-disulfide isomerase